MGKIVKLIIEYLKSQEIVESSSTKDKQWNAVIEQVKFKQRRILYRKISIALSFAAIIVFGIFLFSNIDKLSHNDQNISLESIASKMSDPNNISEVTLIVSEDKVIQLDNQSDILYSNQGTVSVNSKQIDEDLSKKVQTVEYNQLIVPRGKRVFLSLSDGTKLWVNSGTKVIYPRSFVKEKREIYIDGEVFLNVSKNANMPFIVKTPMNFEVEVLGTTFNICTYKEISESTVVLAEGSVKVRNTNNKEIILSPNQLISVVDNNLGQVVSVNANDYTSWTQGVLVLNSQPLNDVLKKLSLYFGEEINIAPDIQNIKISGKLELKDELSTILDGLTNIVPITISKGTDKVFNIKKRV